MGSLPIFAVLPIILAALCHERFRSAQENGARDLLNQQWAAMKGYPRIESDGPTRRILWYYDNSDPAEADTVSNIRRVYLLTDENGRILEQSRGYREMGIDSPIAIRGRVSEALSSNDPGKAFWRTRQNTQGALFLVRAGVVFDERHRSPYYVAIGTSLSRNGALLLRFDWILAAAIAFAMLLGWSFGRQYGPTAWSRRGNGC